MTDTTQTTELIPGGLVSGIVVGTAQDQIGILLNPLCKDGRTAEIFVLGGPRTYVHLDTVQLVQQESLDSRSQLQLAAIRASAIYATPLELPKGVAVRLWGDNPLRPIFVGIYRDMRLNQATRADVAYFDGVDYFGPMLWGVQFLEFLPDSHFSLEEQVHLQRLREELDGYPPAS